MADNSSGYDGGAVVVYVTVPDDAVAKSLASGIVEKKLAACVNVIPGTAPSHAYNVTLTHEACFRQIIWWSGGLMKYLSTYSPAGIASYYWWENQVNVDSEILLMIKTRQDLLHELTGGIAQLQTWSSCS